MQRDGATLVDARWYLAVWPTYLLLVELGSLLLLGALVAAYHLGKRESGTGTNVNARLNNRCPNE